MSGGSERFSVQHIGALGKLDPHQGRLREARQKTATIKARFSMGWVVSQEDSEQRTADYPLTWCRIPGVQCSRLRPPAGRS